jgi:hypothetical protein
VLKVRYFQIELPLDLARLADRIRSRENLNPNRQIVLSRLAEDDIISTYRVNRIISIRKFLEDGSTVLDSAATTDLHTIRLFKKHGKIYLSIIDPPRSSKIVSDFLDDTLAQQEYFIEPLEITTSIIDRHVANFDSAKLVSAKIRDFAVYDGAVGRLEVTSHAGLIPTIAPFLENKFHRIDSLTYEVTLGFTQGLINYNRNGTIRVSSPLIDRAFPLFEDCLK